MSKQKRTLTFTFSGHVAVDLDEEQFDFAEDAILLDEDFKPLRIANVSNEDLERLLKKGNALVSFSNAMKFAADHTVEMDDFQVLTQPDDVPW